MKLHLAALLILGATTAAAQVDESLIRDARMSAAVDTLLMVNDQLSSFDLFADGVGGVMTLRGYVRDDIQRELAEDLAFSVDGVTEVINLIEIEVESVEPEPGDVVPEPGDVVPEPGEVVLEPVEAELAPEDPVVPSRTRNFRQRVVDLSTKAAIRSRLLYNKQMKGFRISVDVERGIATLSGIVNTSEQKDRIGEITYATKGVDAVYNHLLVRPKHVVKGIAKIGVKISDEWLEKRVETGIMLNRHVSIRRVDVEVNGGICILTGIVDGEPQRALVASIARDIQGISEVENNIMVRSYESVEIELLEPFDELSEEESPTTVSPVVPGELPPVSSEPLSP